MENKAKVPLVAILCLMVLLLCGIKVLAGSQSINSSVPVVYEEQVLDVSFNSIESDQQESE